MDRANEEDMQVTPLAVLLAVGDFLDPEPPEPPEPTGDMESYLDRETERLLGRGYLRGLGLGLVLGAQHPSWALEVHRELEAWSEAVLGRRGIPSISDAQTVRELADRMVVQP